MANTTPKTTTTQPQQAPTQTSSSAPGTISMEKWDYDPGRVIEIFYGKEQRGATGK